MHLFPTIINYSSPTCSVWERYYSRRVSSWVSDKLVCFYCWFFQWFLWKVSLPVIDVHLWFCVCEMLAFWRRNDESTFGALFSSCHFDILPVTSLLFSQHMVKDFVLLFRCVCWFCFAFSFANAFINSVISTELN